MYKIDTPPTGYNYTFSWKTVQHYKYEYNDNNSAGMDNGYAAPIEPYQKVKDNAAKPIHIIIVDNFSAEYRGKAEAERRAYMANPLAVAYELSPLVDAAAIVKSVKTGNYKEAAIIFALALIPGEIDDAARKGLKGLKGAGTFGKCTEYATDLQKAVLAGKVDVDNISSVTRLKWDSATNSNGIEFDGYDNLTRQDPTFKESGVSKEALTTNGYHEAIEITYKNGTVEIFDNVNPQGILKSEFVNRFWLETGRFQVKRGENVHNMGKRTPIIE